MKQITSLVAVALATIIFPLLAASAMKIAWSPYCNEPAYQFENTPDKLLLLNNLLLMQEELAEAGSQKRSLPLYTTDSEIVQESIALCASLARFDDADEWGQLGAQLTGTRTTYSNCPFLNDLNNIKTWVNTIAQLTQNDLDCLNLCTKLIGGYDHNDGQPYIVTTSSSPTPGLTIDNSYPAGRYCLREYVNYTGTGPQAIYITRQDVIIDLQGNTLDGNTSTAANGIEKNTDTTTNQFAVENGFVTRFANGSAIHAVNPSISSTSLPFQKFNDLILTESQNGLTAIGCEASIERVQADRNTNYGFYIYYNSERTFLKDCRARNNTIQGFHIDCESQNVFEKCIATGNGQDGFYVARTADSPLFKSCIAIANGTSGAYYGFKISGSPASTRLINCFARSNGSTPSTYNYDTTNIPAAYAPSNISSGQLPYGVNVNADA